jgi:nitroreductase
MRFELVAATEGDRTALRGLGTYGFIKGAPGFVVGTVENSTRDLEDFGFTAEAIVLAATDLGLGTCWLGGTFNRSAFATKIGLRDNEALPAVLAIGHAASRRGAVERLIRLGAGAKRRKPFAELFFDEAFGMPLSLPAAGPYGDPLEMVRLGPSASNRQPWRIVRTTGPDVFHLYCERSPGYDRGRKIGDRADLQRIDMGIAMCHFQLCAVEAGLSGAWHAPGPPDIAGVPQRTEYIASWEVQTK